MTPPGIVELPVDAAWAIGFVLAMCRMAAFMVASPITNRMLPSTARIGVVVALSIATVRPVADMIEVGDLIGAVGINVVIGVALGWVSGLILNLFGSAGAIVDLISGLSIAMVFDPVMGDMGGVFQRMFHLVAITLFVVTGGLSLLVGGLMASVTLLPLDASIAPDPGLTGLVIATTAQMFRSAVELALPIMGVLLLLELALGLASRFAPQANVFLLGLPAKIFASITVVGSAWVLFPDAMSNAQATVMRNFEATLRGLGA